MELMKPANSRDWQISKVKHLWLNSSQKGSVAALSTTSRLTAVIRCKYELTQCSVLDVVTNAGGHQLPYATAQGCLVSCSEFANGKLLAGSASSAEFALSVPAGPGLRLR